MTFSSLGEGRPVQMFAPFRAAMGLALDGDRLRDKRLDPPSSAAADEAATVQPISLDAAAIAPTRS
jgi:hypothetical protein